MEEIRIEANGNIGPIDSSRIPRFAGAATFARVLAEMFSGDSRASAMILPTRPLDAMYAAPARTFEVLDLTNGSKTTFPAVESFSFSPDGEWLLMRPQATPAGLVKMGQALWRPAGP